MVVVKRKVRPGKGSHVGPRSPDVFHLLQRIFEQGGVSRRSAMCRRYASITRASSTWKQLPEVISLYIVANVENENPKSQKYRHLA